MRYLTHVDGRPLAFDRNTVIYFEAHESGEGTRLRFAPAERPLEVHVRENYATVLKEVTETEIDRALGLFISGDESAAAPLPLA